MDTNSLIKKVLLAFEQSSTTIKYKEVYCYDDGPNDTKQVTLSFGVTEYGNLKKLLKDYCQHNTASSKRLESYINLIGKEPLAGNRQFKILLEQAGDDPVMQKCQEQAYEDMYITPAYTWCKSNGLELPLSQLVVCDSFLHSGSILSKIRNMFSETLPIKGGDEKEWITQYCKNRKKWLANHSRTILHKTVYRMNFMLECIENNDWNLEEKKYVANGVIIV